MTPVEDRPTYMRVVSTMHPWRQHPGDYLEAMIESLQLPSARTDAELSEPSLQKAVDAKLIRELHDEALGIAKAAMNKARDSNDKKEEALAKYLIAHIKALQGDYQSIEVLPELLRDISCLYGQAGAKTEEESVLKDVLGFHLTRGEAEKAGAVEEDILSLSKGVPQEAAAARLRVAAVHFASKETGSSVESALLHVEEARNAFAGLSDQTGQAKALTAKAVLHLSQQNFDGALQALQSACDVQNDKKQKAHAQYAMAQVHISKENGVNDAVAALKKARAMMQEASDKGGEVEILQVLSELYLSRKEAPEASSAGREALAVAKASGDKKLEAKALALLVSVSIAGVDNTNGKGLSPAAEKEALNYAEDQVMKANEAGDFPLEASAKGSIATILLQTGDRSRAAAKARELLTACRERHYRKGENDAKVLLGAAICADKPESSEGLRYLLEAAESFDGCNDRSGSLSAHFSLANIFFQRGDLEDGLHHSREVLSICRQLGDRINEDAMKKNIEVARELTAERRRNDPKRPSSEGLGLLSASAGPQACPLTSSRVPGNMLDIAAAGRKYWGTPAQVDNPADDVDERPPSHSVVWGHALSDNSPSQMCLDLTMMVGAMAKGDIAKIPIIVNTSGVNGRGCGDMQVGSMSMVSAITLWGVIRTCRAELPQVPILTMDFAAGMTLAEIPRQLRPPLGVFESCYYHGQRWEPQLTAVHSLFRRDLKRDNLTGGGGGYNHKDGSSNGDNVRQSKFNRKGFSWTGPSTKLDFCWYRQEWKAVGPAEGEIISSTTLPVKPLRKY
eukprot:TRINITY_DN32088_c0_g1_i1.p1 TRINITY_DN32088_c0_g1~~TRINITY_DN32088_c0_g1_i1.p1  ORF type:complete len:794 (+),score=175.52 TRINITY_DN32088_c0_g1_i1:70-2451(+)